MIRRRAVVLGAGAAACLAACGREPRFAALPAGATVLAFGDSLTYGTGASADGNYPAVLARLTGWNVVNAGVPSDTSAAGLARLPELLKQHSPALVLVSIGGNDFLRRLPDEETRANVRATCQLVLDTRAQVLLIGVPEPSALQAATHSLTDHPLYGEVAIELRVPLYSGGWARVLGDPDMRSDPIHANDRGYQAFAEGLAERARELGLLAS